MSIVALTTVVPYGAEIVPFLNSIDRGYVVSPSGNNRLHFFICKAKTGHYGTHQMWMVREYFFGIKVVELKGYVDDPLIPLPVHWYDDNTCDFCFDFNRHRESGDGKFIAYEFE
jgi:hypothetical protein